MDVFIDLGIGCFIPGSKILFLLFSRLNEMFHKTHTYILKRFSLKRARGWPGTSATSLSWIMWKSCNFSEPLADENNCMELKIKKYIWKHFSNCKDTFFVKGSPPYPLGLAFLVLYWAIFPPWTCIMLLDMQLFL